jgi:hypothetical protein
MAQVLLILSLRMVFFDLIGNTFYHLFYWFYDYSYLCWFWDKLIHRFLRFKSFFFIQTEIFFLRKYSILTSRL